MSDGPSTKYNENSETQSSQKPLQKKHACSIDIFIYIHSIFISITYLYKLYKDVYIYIYRYTNMDFSSPSATSRWTVSLWAPNEAVSSGSLRVSGYPHNNKAQMHPTPSWQNAGKLRFGKSKRAREKIQVILGMIFGMMRVL